MHSLWFVSIVFTTAALCYIQIRQAQHLQKRIIIIKINYYTIKLVPEKYNKLENKNFILKWLLDIGMEKVQKQEVKKAQKQEGIQDGRKFGDLYPLLHSIQ